MCIFIKKKRVHTDECHREIKPEKGIWFGSEKGPGNLEDGHASDIKCFQGSVLYSGYNQPEYQM